MPRPRFSGRLVADTFEIPSATTVFVDVDLLDSFYPQLMIKATYPATGNPAGLVVRIYPGFIVDAAQNIEYADNFNVVAEMVAPILSSGSTQIRKSAFAANPEVYPRFIRLGITNTDLINAVFVRIVGDW